LDLDRASRKDRICTFVLALDITNFCHFHRFPPCILIEFLIKQQTDQPKSMIQIILSSSLTDHLHSHPIFVWTLFYPKAPSTLSTIFPICAFEAI
jgi:hypothetical protein